MECSYSGFTLTALQLQSLELLWEDKVRTIVNTSEVARVTLVLPSELWERVKQLAPAGRRSQMVAEALQAEVQRRERWEAFERARSLGDSLATKYGLRSSAVDDINQMREERDAELAGLR
jgi:hypothetical protein